MIRDALGYAAGAALVLGACFLCTFGGAAFGLGGSGSRSLPLDARSQLVADYGVDPAGLRFAPLDGAILEDAARDSGATLELPNPVSPSVAVRDDEPLAGLEAPSPRSGDTGADSAPPAAGAFVALPAPDDGGGSTGAAREVDDSGSDPSEPPRDDPLIEPLDPVLEPLDPLLEPLEPVLEPVVAPLIEPLEAVVDPILEPVVEIVEPVTDPILELLLGPLW